MPTLYIVGLASVQVRGEGEGEGKGEGEDAETPGPPSPTPLSPRPSPVPGSGSSPSPLARLAGWGPPARPWPGAQALPLAPRQACVPGVDPGEGQGGGRVSRPQSGPCALQEGRTTLL